MSENEDAYQIKYSPEDIVVDPTLGRGTISEVVLTVRMVRKDTVKVFTLYECAFEANKFRQYDATAIEDVIQPKGTAEYDKDVDSYMKWLEDKDENSES
jgi:hypothetical protein